MSALYMFFIRNFFPCLIPFTPKPIYLARCVYPIGNTFTNKNFKVFKCPLKPKKYLGKIHEFLYWMWL